MPSAPCVASVLRTVVGFVPSLSFVRRHCSGTTTFVNQRRRYKGTTTTATSWKMSVAPATTVGISGLEFESTFTTELPADPERRNEPRPVQNAAFSFVESTPPSADDNTSAWREASSAGQVDSSESRRLVLRKALVAWSPSCAGLFDLPDDRYPNSEEEETIIDVLGGFGPLCPGMVPYAMCYGGHQFGNWAGQLGDGRAISLGEYVNARSERWEIQVKGAGKTPYSRFADGRAVLRSSVREFLCSEAMHFLGVPTTRALSLITTGAGVVRDMFYDGNPQLEPGAVVARVAPSFLRLGNFQIAAARGDFDLLRKTADYAIKWHFPQFKTLPTDVDSDGDNRYTALLRKVAELNAEMVAMWQGIGFVHGVMNTDNFSILGLTIDYGPYGFLDNFDPNYTPNTTDIPGRRYKFSGQPMVAHWNIMQFAKCMMPLCGPDAIEIVEDFGNIYKKAQAGVMSKKMGLMEWKGEEDEALVDGFLACMHYSNADFTNTWRALSRIETSSTEEERDAWYQSLCLDSDERGLKEWMDWLNKYQQRLKENEKMTNEERVTSMNKMNPVYILRNYMAQTAIEMAEKGDYSEVRQLYELLKNPYEEQDNMEKYTEPPPKWATRRGVCVNSCSS